MRLKPIEILLVLVVLTGLAVVGCMPASQKLEKQATLHNQQAHESGARVQADTDKLLTAAHNARIWIEGLRDRFRAYLADPAHNPAPTTQETVATLDKSDAELGTIDPLGASIKKNSAQTVESADAQKAADDARVKAATDEQRKSDEHSGAVLVGFAVAGLVFLAFERFSNFTFLVAVVPSIAAGALAFCLFGDVLHAIQGWLNTLFKIVEVALYVVVPAVIVWYVWQRHQKGGFSAWFVNVENKVKADLAPSPENTKAA